MFYPVDPEEYCVNCHAKITGVYRRCAFCGKVWWKKDDKNDQGDRDDV